MPFIESSQQRFLRGKKTMTFEIFRLLFLRQKRMSATKEIGKFLTNIQF